MIRENSDGNNNALFDSVYAQYRKRNKGKLLLLSAFSLLAVAAGLGVSLICGDSDFFLGVAALFSSFMSVYIALEANNLNALMYAATIDNNAASVRPYIQMDTNYKSSKRELKVSLRNTGIGPAMITEMWAWVGNENRVDPSATVFYHTILDLLFYTLDTSDFSTDAKQFFSDCINGMTEVEFYTIPPNESIDIIHIKFPADMSADDITQVVDTLSSSTVFCSYVDVYRINNYFLDGLSHHSKKPEFVSSWENPTERDLIIIRRRQFEFERSLLDVKKLYNAFSDE